ncbi:calponin domain-containing protein [Cocos nucifera]|uniref:Calponin domain-containing protein n=1 Tax=Cocos nucifera TaxID=13894 RepID=A0A8K0NDA3_COCNU|nr:calponin domain-containing protein [Cocos nucifera]
MESPFFASRRNPTRHGYVPQPRPRPPAVKPRVVSIPVRFVRSEEEEKTAKKPAAAAAARQPAEVDRAGAAVKVQKVFRGFLVRKNVRVVHKVAAEVDEIERKIRAEEEVVRRDEKARLRVNEMLMALLLRLDSVRGVRDYRKKVIRKVISLQDALDSIAAARDEKEIGGETLGAEIGAPAETQESPAVAEEHRIDEEAVPQECGDGISEVRDASAKDLETGDVQKEEAKVEEDESVEETLEAKDEAPDSKDLAEGSVTIESKSVEEGNIGDPMEETGGNSAADTAPPGTGGKTEEEVVEESELKEEGEGAILDPMEQERAPEMGAEERSTTWDQMQGVVESPGVKEVMERVMTENESLKRLVAELCERSAQQCRLMGGLVERVEHLERRMEKRRRKNMKRRHAENKYNLCS